MWSSKKTLLMILGSVTTLAEFDNSQNSRNCKCSCIWALSILHLVHDAFIYKSAHTGVNTPKPFNYITFVLLHLVSVTVFQNLSKNATSRMVFEFFQLCYD